jgi:hypothetical protein
MTDTRRENADQAFSLYDMGDMEVKDTGTWNTIETDEWSMPVYVENADEPSVRLTFVVRFAPDSPEVADAYIAG